MKEHMIYEHILSFQQCAKQSDIVPIAQHALIAPFEHLMGAVLAESHSYSRNGCTSETLFAEQQWSDNILRILPILMDLLTLCGAVHVWCCSYMEPELFAHAL